MARLSEAELDQVVFGTLGILAMIFPKVKEVQRVAQGGMAAYTIYKKLGPLAARLETATLAGKGVHLTVAETAEMYTMFKALENAIKGA